MKNPRKRKKKKTVTSGKPRMADIDRYQLDIDRYQLDIGGCWYITMGGRNLSILASIGRYRHLSEVGLENQKETIEPDFRNFLFNSLGLVNAHTQEANGSKKFHHCTLLWIRSWFPLIPIACDIYRHICRYLSVEDNGYRSIYADRYRQTSASCKS